MIIKSIEYINVVLRILKSFERKKSLSLRVRLRRLVVFNEKKKIELKLLSIKF